MSPRLKPYPEYKESGVPWLGRVPRDWRLIKTKYLFRERSEKGHPAEPLLACTQSQGVIRKERYGSRTVTAQKGLHLLKLACVGDFVISLRAFEGGIELVHDRGILSPAYNILVPRPDLDAPFLAALLKSAAFISGLSFFVTGIREGQNIDYERLSRTELPVPSSDEQRAIGRFLRWLGASTARLVRAKRKLIHLLNDQKQAIIQHAVTRGLDPNVHLKASSVEGLGAIPERWRVATFTRCVVERSDYRGATPTKTESGVQLITARNVRQGFIDYDRSREFVAMDQYEAIMRRGRPRKRDLLLTMEAPLGHAALVDREDIALAQRLVRFRLEEQKLLPEFALLAVTARYFQDQLMRRATGSTASGIKASKLPELQVVLPDVLEQQAILRSLQEPLSQVASAIGRAQREIDLLGEYRTRLIADVVTGKLDVRHTEVPDVSQDDVLDMFETEDETELRDDAESAEEAEA